LKIQSVEDGGSFVTVKIDQIKQQNKATVGSHTHAVMMAIWQAMKAPMPLNIASQMGSAAARTARLKKLFFRIHCIRLNLLYS